MTKKRIRDLTDAQCLELAKKIESMCDRLAGGNRMGFDSAGHALINAVRNQAAHLRIVLEILDEEKRRNTNDSREN